MLKTCFVAALAVALTTPTLSLADDIFPRQRFTLPAAQIDADSFEIVEADGAGNSQFWCAAGIYARKALGQRLGDLTVEVPRGPSQSMPGRKSVVFTTDPAAATSKSVALSVRQAGLSFSITHANAVCPRNDLVRVRTGPDTLLRR